MEVRANSKQTKAADENKPVNDSERGKVYRKKKNERIYERQKS